MDHPQGDPKLPSYVHPHLKEIAADLAMAADCWNMLRGAKGRYLPREPKEPPQAYEGRLARARYPGFFRAAITAFTGVLSRYEVKGAPATFDAAMADIDGEGSSLKAFLMRADQALLRDGGCLLMVDMPAGRPGSRAEELAMGRRPVLRLAERMMVRNWRTERVDGIELPSAVSVLEWHEVPDGDFGVTMEPRYRVMRGGQWSVVRIKGATGGRGALAWQLEVVDQGVFTDTADQPLPFPPVVWYAPGREGFGKGDLPLYDLVQGTLDWFMANSSYRELLNKTAMPVAVRKGAPIGPNGQPAPLVIGPNSVVDLNPDGDFDWREVSGSSLQRHEANLEHIERLIDRQTLSFLFGQGGDRTATHAELESAQVQATLTSIGEQKASAMQTVMGLWTLFTGESLDPAGAGLAMAKGVIDRPVDTETLRLAKDLYDAGLLRRESVTALEGRAGLLPQGTTPEDEALALAAEDELLNAETPGPADPALTGEGQDAPGDGENQGQE